MQRDNRMIRELLIRFRDEHSPGQGEIEPESEKENYHMYLLLDAKLIEADKFDYMDSNLSTYVNLRITNLGHDFLESAENDTVWERTKELLGKKGIEIGSIPLDVLTSYLKVQMNKYLGIN